MPMTTLSSGTFASHYPVTGEVIAQYPIADREQVQAAVTAVNATVTSVLAQIGNEAPNVSKHNFNLWTTYTIAEELSAALPGKIKVGARDDLRFMATAGDGLGRYIGLNIVNDAALDAAGNLDPIFTWSGFAAYRHVWSGNLRSNLAGSYFKADNPVRLTTNQVTDESWNAFVNLIWTPVGPLNVGVELMYAERTLEDGRSGNLQRVQVSTQYNF